MNTEKRKYTKSGNFTKEKILKRKINAIFSRFEKLHEKAGDGWNQKIKNIQDKSFEDIQEEENTTLPTNNGKRKYIKSGRFTKDAILERSIGKTLKRFNKIPNEEKSWFQDLREKITNLFFKPDVKFVLEKEALNGVVKRWIIFI